MAIPPNASPVLWRVEGFARDRHPPGVRYWWDNHQRRPEDRWVLQYTCAGQVVLRDKNGDHVAAAGQAMLFHFGESSSYGLTPACRSTYVCDWVNLRGAGLTEHCQHLRQRHGPVIPCSDEVLVLMRRLMRLADPRVLTAPEVVAAAAHALLMQLSASLHTTFAATQAPVDRAIDALVANPHHPWSLKTLADRHGCSREHLTRAFALRVGTSPGRWLALQRVQRALDLLSGTTLSLREIAVRCGYSSTHTLARQVRESAGRGPRALRDRLPQDQASTSRTATKRP